MRGMTDYRFLPKRRVLWLFFPWLIPSKSGVFSRKVKPPIVVLDRSRGHWLQWIAKGVYRVDSLAKYQLAAALDENLDRLRLIEPVQRSGKSQGSVGPFDRELDQAEDRPK